MFTQACGYAFSFFFFFSAFYPSVQSIYSLLFQWQIALTLYPFALHTPFAHIPSICVVRCYRTGCIDCTVDANCQLIVNHLLVDFNRISHTFVSCRTYSIQNGFEEIKYDYSADLKNVSRLGHRYCVGNIILSMFVCCAVLCTTVHLSSAKFIPIEITVWVLVCLTRTCTE